LLLLVLDRDAIFVILGGVGSLTGILHQQFGGHSELLKRGPFPSLNPRD
jgi:hypothetical protein